MRSTTFIAIAFVILIASFAEPTRAGSDTSVSRTRISGTGQPAYIAPGRRPDDATDSEAEKEAAALRAKLDAANERVAQLERKLGDGPTTAPSLVLKIVIDQQNAIFNLRQRLKDAGINPDQPAPHESTSIETLNAKAKDRGVVVGSAKTELATIDAQTKQIAELENQLAEKDHESVRLSDDLVISRDNAANLNKRIDALEAERAISRSLLAGFLASSGTQNIGRTDSQILQGFSEAEVRDVSDAMNRPCRVAVLEPKLQGGGAIVMLIGEKDSSVATALMYPDLPDGDPKNLHFALETVYFIRNVTGEDFSGTESWFTTGFDRFSRDPSVPVVLRKWPGKRLVVAAFKTTKGTNILFSLRRNTIDEK